MICLECLEQVLQKRLMAVDDQILKKSLKQVDGSGWLMMMVVVWGGMGRGCVYIIPPHKNELMLQPAAGRGSKRSNELFGICLKSPSKKVHGSG